MKITNIQAVVFVNTVNDMTKKKLPIKLIFAINHNLNLMMNQIKPYEEARKVLLERYENEADAMPEFNRLLEESVEHSIKTIPYSELEKIDEEASYDKLSISEINAISFMVEDDKTPKI